MLRAVNAMDCFSLEKEDHRGDTMDTVFVEIGSPGKKP
jgi:hypothetical protein